MTGAVLRKLYCPGEFISPCSRLLDGAWVRDDITLDIYDNATIVVDKQRMTFGVFDNKNKFVPMSWSYRYTNKKHQKKPLHPDLRHIKYFDYDAIYCGRPMDFHFGHFLLEGIARLWPVMDKKYANAKLVFVSPNESLAVYAADILRMLGVLDRVVLLHESACFRRVIVPMQSHVIGLWVSRQYSDTCRAIADAVHGTDVYDKIYLSRVKLHERKIYGEESVQKIFQKNGYKIIYPETLSLARQISLVKNCRCLAGCAGTALHLSVFMKPGGRVICIKRNSAPMNDTFGVQYLLNRPTKFDFVMIYGSTETTTSMHFAPDVPQVIGVTPYMHRFMDDENFKYTLSDIQPDMDAMRQYDLAMVQYRHRHGSRFMVRVKKFGVRVVVMFVPVRQWRHQMRAYFTKKLNIPE